MKTKTLLAVVVSTFLMVNQVNASGIPTVDGASVAQRAMQHIETVNNMMEQIKKFEQQIQNQIDHLNAIKGARGLGRVDAVLDVLENAPDEWADIYKTVQKIDPTQTLEKVKIDPDDQIRHAEILQKEAIADYNKVSGIFKDLVAIANKIKSGEVIDPKDAADLANRIQLNIAMITAMNAKYDMMQKQFELAERQQSQKMVEWEYCVREAKSVAERNKCVL